MSYADLKHGNTLDSGSRYASDFDYIMHDYCLKKFEPILKNKKCLEMGCYHGEMTFKLSEICSHITAADYDQVCIDKTLARCASKKNVAAIKSDFNTLESYGNFDVLYLSHALEHVENDIELLKHISNQIDTSTKLITIVPNGRSLSRRIAVKMKLLPEELVVTDFEKSIGHYRTYDLDSLTKLHQEAGFRILESGGIMPKIFSNNQFDKCINKGILDRRYLDALNELSPFFKDICSSIYVLSERHRT